MRIALLAVIGPLLLAVVGLSGCFYRTHGAVATDTVLWPIFANCQSSRSFYMPAFGGCP